MEIIDTISTNIWFNLFLMLTTISYRIFETGSSFRGGQGTAGGGGGLAAVFRDFFASASEIFILAWGLGAGLSFYGV